MNTVSRHGLWGRISFLMALAVGLALSGCGRIQNPHPGAQPKRSSWYFFNYTIPSAGLASTPAEAPSEVPRFDAATLHLLVETNYFPANVIQNFTDVYGAQVTVTCYKNNRELYRTITRQVTVVKPPGDTPSAGAPTGTVPSYDVLMAPGFMIERFIKEDQLAELDPKALPNLKNLGTEYRVVPYDPGNKHSIPYLWSTAGIAYNYNHLDRHPQKWTDLFEPHPLDAATVKGKLSILPSPRRVIAAGLLSLGYAPNSDNPAEIDAASQFVLEQMKKNHFQIRGMDLPEALASEEILLAMARSSDVAEAAASNANVFFCVPDDGSWITVDNFAIPKNVPPETRTVALAFLNFMLQPTQAGEVSNFSFHASTLPEARAYIHAAVRNGPAFTLPPKSLLQLDSDIQTNKFSDEFWRQVGGSADDEVRLH